MESTLNIEDLHEKAQKVLSKNAYDYYASGARDENTLKENVNSFSKIKIIPRCLVGRLSQIDMSISLFGESLDIPIMISPTAMHKMGHSGAFLVESHETRFYIAVRRRDWDL